jgi:hypothetical protein
MEKTKGFVFKHLDFISATNSLCSFVRKSRLCLHHRSPLVDQVAKWTSAVAIRTWKFVAFQRNPQAVSSAPGTMSLTWHDLWLLVKFFNLKKNVFFGLETSEFGSTCKMCRQWLRLIRRAGWLAPPRNMAAHANYAKITILQQKTCVIIQQHVCQQYWASVEMFYQNIP